MSRILICTTVPETIETILKNQPRYLARYFEIDLATSPGDAVARISTGEGVDVHEVPMKRGIDPFRDLRSLYSMIRVLLRTRPQVVHSYTPKAGLIAMVASWICRVPVRVHTFTGLIFPTARGLMRWLLIFIDRLICACATHVVPEGQGVRSDLSRFRITRKPLAVIGYGNIAGVNTAHFDPMELGVEQSAKVLRGNLGIGGADFVFCFVGRLNKDKGLFELIHSFKALPSKARLLLVGSVDQSAPIADDLVDIINSHGRIHSLGFLEDIRAALRASDTLVLPSYREGFPNVILQAGAMELPVIATNINGCNEVVEPGLNGWLVPSRDVAGLRTAMGEAMQMSGVMLRGMGRQARERIRQRFEQREHWERMVQFYKEISITHGGIIR
ncbi:glycosyltransferase family 4 protein [Variovorax sp. J2P1-59]|uniref:glycosyltransferase family 4 protein n=1 Tax=Variovorax flavidus TaxID=3053501 RepID=UPI002576E02E|nr:glycosyltransferase family 4 protein [Variovorax sp. J2P1-59]MDM0073094.1 glycosyltransferase family 4 protein [Variovorax sp. J2P1-59]